MRIAWLPTSGLALLAGCGTSAASDRSTDAPDALAFTVLAERPHDPTSFTQGLVFADGVLYESAGQYGASSLRVVDPASGAVEERHDLPERYFAEGLALVDDRLIQLTWQEETAFVYDRDTLTPVARLDYEGEGWGLCWDGRVLYMSDGSAELTARDPATLAVQGSVTVTDDAGPVSDLNELECVGGRVFANVWGTDRIVRIDPATGRVDGELDASSLLTDAERAALPAGAVLNGIADAGGGRLFLTGKYWPTMFEIQLAGG